MKYIWLDCDPGHDDATAILLALNSVDVHLLGISTVHGNADASCTYNNALRCLHAFGASADIHAFPGASKPLIRTARHDPEIHGVDGLGGVEGLYHAEHPHLSFRKARASKQRAVEAIAAAIAAAWRDGAGQKTSVLSTGPMTNIALFVSVYPDLIDGVEQFVFMGGGIGQGNRSAVAEFNILCDPEAAQIVLNTDVKKVMIPINVTHTAIVTKTIHAALLSGHSLLATDSIDLPPAVTPLRNTLSSLIGYFADSYRSTFGFEAGPPLHDALTIAYVAIPEMFKCRRYHVDVELCGQHTAGETVADVWNYHSCDHSWGASGKNCLVAEKLDVDRFFQYFLDCTARCDKISPLNAQSIVS